MSDFGRRTWNREEYAGQKPTSRLQNLSEHELAELKVRYTDHHRLMQDTMSRLNKKTLSSNLTSFKKGKQYGFYCDLCDLTFKDNLQYINHLNHKTHEIQFENIFGEPLISEVRDNDDIPIKEFEDHYKQLVNRFVKEHQVKKSNPKKKLSRDSTIEKYQTEAQSDISKVMNFANFGSTKK